MPKVLPNLLYSCFCSLMSEIHLDFSLFQVSSPIPGPHSLLPPEVQHSTWGIFAASFLTALSSFQYLPFTC